MDPEAEGDVAVVLAPQVQLVGAEKRRGSRLAEHWTRKTRWPSSMRLAAQLEVGAARRTTIFGGAVVAVELLDRV